MRHRWSLRLGFRQLLILWAAGSSLAASRSLEAPVTAEQNSRSDCKAEQVSSSHAMSGISERGCTSVTPSCVSEQSLCKYAAC